jgi:hypothetical protein
MRFSSGAVFPGGLDQEERRTVDGEDSPFLPIEALLDERSKHPVLLVDTVEKGADVTLAPEHSPGKPNGTFPLYR